LELASIAAGLDLRRRKRLGNSVAFPAATLTVAVVLSLSAQVVEAEHSVIGWLAAALPALGFLAMVKMALGRADHGPTVPVPDGPNPVRANPPRTTDETRSVQDLPDLARTVLGQSRTAVDVTGLVPAARAAAATLAAQGITLNRANLAAQLRADGHQLSTAAATALVRLVRDQPATDLSTTDDVPAAGENSSNATTRRLDLARGIGGRDGDRVGPRLAARLDTDPETDSPAGLTAQASPHSNGSRSIQTDPDGVSRRDIDA
jgi:hypothetical protein